MTTVTAEQIVALIKARRERHEALAKALRDAWKSGDKSWLDLAAIALSDHFADAGKMVTALQERVEGLERERDRALIQRDSARMQVHVFISDRNAAEARADALSAELEGLKRGSSSSVDQSAVQGTAALDPERLSPAGLEDLIERLEDRRRIMWNAPLKDGGYAKLVAPEDLSAAILGLYRLEVLEEAIAKAGGFYTSVSEVEPQNPFEATHWRPLERLGKPRRAPSKRACASPICHIEGRCHFNCPEDNRSSEVQAISPNVVSAGNAGLDTINTSQNHPSTNGEG